MCDGYENVYITGTKVSMHSIIPTSRVRALAGGSEAGAR